MADTSPTLTVGGDRTTGQSVRTQNVLAASSIANIVKSSLGPVGLDKMLVDDIGNLTITNDGATILKLLEVEHPAQPQTNQMGQFQAPQPSFQQRQRMSYPQQSQGSFQGDGTQHMQQQFNPQHNQQMIHQVHQQQVQIRQQFSGGKPVSPQMSANQNPSPQQFMQQVRSPTSLPQTVRSPQPIASPHQQLNPSPRQPQMSPHHVISNPSHPGVHDANQMNSETMLFSGGMSLQNQGADSGLAPLTPQDQLSKYVETL